MEKLIYDALNSVYGDSFGRSINKWMLQVIEIMSDIIESLKDQNAFLLLQTFAVSFLIIAFFWNLSVMSSKELLTVEKLLSSMVGFFVACAVLICLPDLLSKIMDLGIGMFRFVDSKLETQTISNNVTFFGYDHFPKISEKVEVNWSIFGIETPLKEEITFGEALKIAFFSPDSMEMSILGLLEGGVFGVKNIIAGGYYIILSLFMLLPSIAATISGFLIVAGIAIELLARAMMAPIGVVQMFGEASRPSGERYLRRFAAGCLSFLVMSITLWVAGWVSQELLLVNMHDMDIDIDNVSRLFNLTRVIKVLVIKFAAIGVLGKARSIADDVMGV